MLSLKSKKDFIALSQITSQPENIKILVVHTPLYLNLDSLPLFRSLIKLDLSNNKLSSFPYIGQLNRLKFLFLHQNQLNLTTLIGAIQKESKKSTLSNQLVWVTFFGNKDVALARHYIANQTNAIAFDVHLIAAEERSPALNVYSQQLNMFSKVADITDIYNRSIEHIVEKDEEELLKEFWKYLTEIKKKYTELHPIIKIQRVWRGWSVRERLYRLAVKEKQIVQAKIKVFTGWKKYIKGQSKLKRLMCKYRINQSHHLGREHINKKLIELARLAKSRVLHNKEKIKNESRFYWTLKANFALLNDFYSLLLVPQSNKLFVCSQDRTLFQSYVVPFVQLFSDSSIELQKNIEYCIALEYNVRNSSSKELVKLLQLNTKSIVTNDKVKGSIILKKQKIFDGLKKTKQMVHFNRFQLEKMRGLQEKLQMKRRVKMDKLFVIEGDKQFLKDVARGIYFFNSRRLTGLRSNNDRINFFSEIHLKKISSAVAIQRFWRGYRTRSRILNQLRRLLVIRRAAITIQRWARQLPLKFRKQFQFIAKSVLKDLKYTKILIDTKDYLQFLQSTAQQSAFPEQFLQLYLNKVTNQLCLAWKKDESKYTVQQSIGVKKIPFDRSFLKEVTGMNDEELSIKFPQQINQQYIQCSRSFLFHFQAQTRVIRLQDRRVLTVDFQEQKQKNFRLFTLCLLSYDNRIKSMLKLLKLPQIRKLKQYNPLPPQLLFICNQNLDQMQVLEQLLKQKEHFHLYKIYSKFYLNQQGNKQLKKEQKLFCFFLQTTQFQNEHHEQPLLKLDQAQRLRQILLKPRKDTSTKGLYFNYKNFRGQNILIRKKALQRSEARTNKIISSNHKFMLSNQKINMEPFSEKESSSNSRHHYQLQHSLGLPAKKSVNSVNNSCRPTEHYSSFRLKTEGSEPRGDVKSDRRSLPLNINLPSLGKVGSEYSSKKSSRNIESKKIQSPINQASEFSNSLLDKQTFIFQTKKRQKKQKQSKKRYISQHYPQSAIINTKKFEKYMADS